MAAPIAQRISACMNGATDDCAGTRVSPRIDCQPLPSAGVPAAPGQGVRVAFAGSSAGGGGLGWLEVVAVASGMVSGSGREAGITPQWR